MREIELGKLLGKNPQPNIVKFIGCVTTEGKRVAFILHELWKLFHVSLPSRIHFLSNSYTFLHKVESYDFG